MDIKVTRQSDDLNMQVWGFSYFDEQHWLGVVGYKVLVRPTKRHKWQVVAEYSYYIERHNTVKADAVPLPADVMGEAVRQFTDALKVGTAAYRPR